MTRKSKVEDHYAVLITAKDVRHLEAFVKLGELPEGKEDVRAEALIVLERCKETLKSHEPKMVKRARNEYQRDGEIEIDDGAVCSRGDDPGLYVQAWVWVYDRR